MPIHVLSPPLQCGASRPVTQGVELVEDTLEGSLAQVSPSLVVAPAGLASVESDAHALELAARLRTAARRSGVALLFGIDVGPPQPGASRLFACLGGAPVIWPITIQRGFPSDASARVLRIGGARLLPLFATEALDPTAGRRIHALGGIDLIVILSHGGATSRWSSALTRLERMSPLVVAANSGGVGRAYATPSLQVHNRALGIPAVEARAA